MALRSVDINTVLTFRACARELRNGRSVLIAFRTIAVEQERMDGLCPVHEATDCIETYFAADYLTGWSLRNFWTWRSVRRRMGGAR